MTNDEKIAYNILHGVENTLVPSTPKLLQKLRGTKQAKCMRAFYSLAEARQTKSQVPSFVLAL